MDQEELSSKISKLSQKLEMRQLTIVNFLKLISSPTKYNSRDLIRILGLPKTHLYRLISEFTDILEPKSKYIEVIGSFESKIAGYAKLISGEISYTNKFGLEKFLLKYQNQRPVPDRKLDQFNATVSTTVKRVIKLAKNGDLKDKNIAFLGDDDLTSIVAATTRQPSKITVFEIDDRLISLIKQISLEKKLKIEIVKQDLFKPLDNNYLDKYDIVFTDPPYTIEGINIFLNQAIKLIKKNFLGRIYLCYGNSDRAREREVEVQKLILDHNVLIKAKYNHFNQYIGAESIGSSSSLYVLDWTPSVKTIQTDYKRVYTHE